MYQQILLSNIARNIMKSARRIDISILAIEMSTESKKIIKKVDKVLRVRMHFVSASFSVQTKVKRFSAVNIKIDLDKQQRDRLAIFFAESQTNFIFTAFKK